MGGKSVTIKDSLMLAFARQQCQVTLLNAIFARQYSKYDDATEQLLLLLEQREKLHAVGSYLGVTSRFLLCCRRRAAVS